jgi:hypothetical protein
MNRWLTRLAELQGARAETPSNVQNVQYVQKPLSGSASEHFERLEHLANIESEPAIMSPRLSAKHQREMLLGALAELVAARQLLEPEPDISG